MNFSLLIALTLKSIRNRMFTTCLTLLSISLSVFLLLGVETVRTETRESFANTISGTDLVVGARSGSVQLLLYSVFRIGNATNNIDWKSYQEISAHPAIAWSVPISLGDSHRGFRVLGTTQDYFEHFRYANDLSLVLDKGKRFDAVYDVVLGSAVAEELGYDVGSQIVLAHGVVDTQFARHQDKPFEVVGILAPTGTPVDKTLHVSLQGIEALHVDWKGGTRSRKTISAAEALEMDLEPKQITAMFLGLKTKTALFKLQRAINQYRKEPLLAILPGLALAELWQLIGVGEKALLVVSMIVLFNALVGLLSAVLTSLNERRREMAILRSLGCRPSQVFVLLTLESFLLGVLGCVFGVLLFYLSLVGAQPILQSELGLSIPIQMLGLYELTILGGIVGVTLILGCLPGYRAYKMSLSEGLSVKL